MRTSKEYPLSGTQFPHLVAGTSVLKDRKRHPLMVCLLWIVVVILTLESYCVSVSAQFPIPKDPPYTAASGALSTITTRQFLLLGGMIPLPSADEKRPDMIGVFQFIALDLTTAWKASHPVWTRVAYPSAAVDKNNFWYTGILAFSLDGKYLGAFGETLGEAPFVGARYSYATSTWSAGPPVSRNLLKENVNNVVQDRETGLVYMATSFFENATALEQMYCFDISKNTLVSFEPIPQAVIEKKTILSSVYSTFGKSILFFCLDMADSFQLLQYVPTTKDWKNMPLLGRSPRARINHCMASNEDGTKVVLFGGLEINPTSKDEPGFAMDLWILDVPTMTWTQGPSVSQPRLDSACGIVNDTFISWGGYTGSSTKPVSILLFDLKTNTFVDEYRPSRRDRASSTHTATSVATATTTSDSTVATATTDTVVIAASTTSDSTVATSTASVVPTGTISMSGDLAGTAVAFGAAASATGFTNSRGKTLGSDTLEINLGKDVPPHNQAAIIGGGAGGVILLVAATGAGFFFYRRKRQYKRAPIFPSSEWSNTDDYGPDRGLASHTERDFARGSDVPALSPYHRGASDPETTETTPMRTEFPEQERQSLVQLQHQQERESTLPHPSLDFSDLAGNSFHPPPYQPRSHYQGRRAFSSQQEGQHWRSPLSPVTSPQQQPLEEHRRKSMQQINRHSLPPQQQYQSGLASPPARDYQQRPIGF